MNKEEIEALVEMKKNCLNASVYDDEKRLIKANAITRALMLEEENKQLKERCELAIEYINDNLIISSILDGKKYYTINNYSFDYRDLLEILKGE